MIGRIFLGLLIVDYELTIYETNKISKEFNFN